MVDSEVRIETKRILLEKFGNDTGAMIDFIFAGDVLDVNKCRIGIIKRHYTRLCRGGMTGINARIETGKAFFRSEKTVENIVYNQFYKKITI